MKIQLLRHATTIVEFAGKKILIDPVLSPAGVKNPIPTKRSGKGLRNPLVDIPIEKTELERLINSVDAILVTHLHSDHFDDFSGELLPKNKPVICQPEDMQVFKKMGFSHIYPIKDTLDWEGINIIRTKCNHGGIYWRRKMGIGSGYVLKAVAEKTLYITGDTIWCTYVNDTIKKHNPETIIIYAGAAQFPLGRSITMNENDIKKVCQASKDSQKIIIHMEAINHCLLKRSDLREFLNTENIVSNIYVPNDGETIDLEF